MVKPVSVGETIKYLVNEVHSLKSDNPAIPVTIISPNISMIQSINRAVIKTGKPVLNVRIETFYQHVCRHTEPILLDQGIPFIDSDQANFLIFEIIERLQLDYFKIAREFPSYIYYFFRVISDIRTGLPENKVKQALISVGDKGKELYRLYQEYLNAKKGMADYADMLKIYAGTDETMILFPGITDEMSLLEKEALDKNLKNIVPDYIVTEADPEIRLKNPLSQSLEIRDVFREVLRLGIHFDRAAIIAPSNYRAPVLEEARRLNIPVFCPDGKEVYPDQAEIFKSALKVIESDFDYYNLKQFFLLKGHFAPIQALIDCGVAVGRDLLKKTVINTYKNTKKDRLKKLKDVIRKFEKIESFKNTPHEMGKSIVEHFITGSQKYVFRAILQDLEDLAPNIDYEKWEGLVLDRITLIREKCKGRQNSVFLTSDYLPGAFDYIFLIGIKEDSFPVRFREDPILLDHERDNINNIAGGTLKTAKEKNLKSPDILSMIIACAEKGWCGYFPTMDLVSGDEQFASFHLIDIVKKIRGKKIVSKDEYQDTLNNIRVPWMLEKPDKCLNYFDWYVHHLIKGTNGFIGHILANQNSSMRHLQANSSFWDARPGEYSGFINMYGRKGQSDNPYFSATELEKFMTCPYQWFVERQLKIRELEEPETMEKPDAMIMGSILHETLDMYMNERKGKKHNKNKLDQVLKKIINNRIASTGEIASIYIEKLKIDIGGMLDNFLEHEADIEKGNRKPTFFEFAFGTSYKASYQDDPVKLKIGKRRFMLSGMIDRIDIDGKEALILDYKGAQPARYKEVNFNHGKSLQPALYSEAFKALMGKKLDIKKIHAGYLPLRGNSKEFTVEHTRDRIDKLAKIIDFVFETMKKGYFFATGDCAWCSYGNVCGKGIELASSFRMENALKDKHVGLLMREYNSFGDF